MSEQKVKAFVEAVKLVLEREFPDLTGSYRYPVKARVIRVRSGAADVELLDKEGSAVSPPLPSLPSPTGLELQPGDTVRVGFYYNDPAHGFIEAKI